MKTSSRLNGILLLCVCAALGGTGCSKKTEPKKDTAAATAETKSEAQTNSATSPASDLLAALPDDAIPTEEDFEPEVEKAIHSNSDLSAELDKIEKELSE